MSEIFQPYTAILVILSQFQRQLLAYFMSTTRQSKVKAGNFGHQVNSDIHLQTMEIQMRRLLMSRLIMIFTVCYFNIILYYNK